MIRSLRIENFALIEAASIHFEGGFTVITGETGSGKSILLNALNLILGERANFGVIGESKDKSVVEAEIDVSGFDLKPFFDEHQLDYFDVAIVRREIYKQGRSRAFINDVPVQLSVLKGLTSGLIHIHSQYNTLELKDKAFQLRMLDILSDSMVERKNYHNAFVDLQLMSRELTQKEEMLAELSSKQDYNSFQLTELQALDLDNTDYDALQADLKKFENADELLSTFSGLVSLLESDNGVIGQLQQVQQVLDKNKGLDEAIGELQQRMQSVLIELRDIAGEAEQQSNSISIDPQRLIELSSKLDDYNKASFKHRTQTQSELKALMDELSNESGNLDQLEQEIEGLKVKISALEGRLNQMAGALHDKRTGAIESIESTIVRALRDLKLENTILEFRASKVEGLLAYGNTQLEIYFSPNPGVPPVPIHQAASGGELSRVMLALQSLMSKRVQLQTILFDEIDTGVSGDVAQKIGNSLREMGEGMQVIAITHLPQVAAKGIQHLSVTKSIVDGVTRTKVVELSDQERLEETARLMSGDEINDAALENAKALMS